MRVHKIGDSIGDFEDQVWTLVEDNVAFNWSIRWYLIFFRQGGLICLLIWFAILTCLIVLNDHLIACSLLHDSLSHMLDRTLFVWYISAWYDCLMRQLLLLHDCMISCLYLLSHFRSWVFRMHPHPSLCTLDYPWVLRDVRVFTIRKPPRKARKCMCRGDDHLA